MAENGTPGTVGSGNPPQGGGDDALYLPIMQQGRGLEDLGEAVQDLADRALSATDITSSFVKAMTTFFSGKGKKLIGGATAQDRQIMNSGGRNPNFENAGSAQDKKIKTGFMRLFQTKWFENTAKTFKGILNAMGSIFMDLLEFFLVMAFLDPSGGFLKSIIKMLMSFAVMIIKIIIKLLPDAIAMMLDVAVMVVQELLKLMPELLGALMVSFTRLGDKFPLLKPFLAPLIALMGALKKFFTLLNAGKIKEAFMNLGKDLLGIVGVVLKSALSILLQIGSWIWEQLKEIVTIDNIKMALGAIWDAVKFVFNEIGAWIETNFGTKAKKLFEALAIVVGALTTAFLIYKGVLMVLAIRTAILNGLGMIYAVVQMLMASPILLVVLAVMALIAAFVLLYVYWDDIVSFVTKAWESFKNWVMNIWNGLSNSIKTAIKIIAGIILAPFLLMLLPLLLVAGAIYLVIKNWGTLKVFFMKTLPDIFKKGWAKMKSFLSNLFDFTFVGEYIKSSWEGFKKSIADSLKRSLTTVLTFGADMWDGLKNAFRDLLDWLESYLSSSYYTIKNKFTTEGNITKQDRMLANTDTNQIVSRLAEMGSLKNQAGKVLSMEELAEAIANNRELVGYTEQTAAIVGQLRRMSFSGDDGAVSRQSADTLKDIKDILKNQARTPASTVAPVVVP